MFTGKGADDVDLDERHHRHPDDNNDGNHHHHHNSHKNNSNVCNQQHHDVDDNDNNVSNNDNNNDNMIYEHDNDNIITNEDCHQHNDCFYLKMREPLLHGPEQKDNDSFHYHQTGNDNKNNNNCQIICPLSICSHPYSAIDSHCQPLKHQQPQQQQQQQREHQQQRQRLRRHSLIDCSDDSEEDMIGTNHQRSPSPEEHCGNMDDIERRCDYGNTEKSMRAVTSARLYQQDSYSMQAMPIEHLVYASSKQQQEQQSTTSHHSSLKLERIKRSEDAHFATSSISRTSQSVINLGKCRSSSDIFFHEEEDVEAADLTACSIQKQQQQQSQFYDLSQHTLNNYHHIHDHHHHHHHQHAPYHSLPRSEQQQKQNHHNTSTSSYSLPASHQGVLNASAPKREKQSNVEDYRSTRFLTASGNTIISPSAGVTNTNNSNNINNNRSNIGNIKYKSEENSGSGNGNGNSNSNDRNNSLTAVAAAAAAAAAASRRDHNIDYSSLFVQLSGTLPTLYRCISCNKIVSNRWHHANIHRPQSHECPVCGQKFTRRDNMKAHCKIKHADIKDRFFSHYVHM